MRRWGDGKNKLKDRQVQEILDVYKKTSSIAKTAEITGRSKVTVNKYVFEISKKKSNSRYCEDNRIVKIDPITGKLLKTYKNQSEAAKDNKIEADTLNRAIKGATRTSGGYIWMKEKDFLEKGATPIKGFKRKEEDDILILLNLI